MSSEESIEDLEKKLKKLEQQKKDREFEKLEEEIERDLLIKIKSLELDLKIINEKLNDLNEKPKKKVVESSKNVIPRISKSTEEEVKTTKNNFFTFAFIAGALIIFFILIPLGNSDLSNVNNSNLQTNLNTDQLQPIEITTTSTTLQEADIAFIQGLKVDISCFATYKGGDKTTDPILKVKINVNNTTKVKLDKMSILVSPKPEGFRDYFKNDSTNNTIFMKTVYYQIDNANRDKEHFVNFYIGSMGLGKPVAKCSTFFN